MTDWAQVHEQVVEKFAKGWARPHPHAWDDMLDENVELIQPLLAESHGREMFGDEVRRLLTFAPDVTGEVLTWAGRDDVLFIDLRLTATVGRARVDVRTFDQLRVTPAATVVRREAFFDPTPIAMAVARHPSAWRPWWRSGLGPLTGRRRMTRS